MSDMTTCKRNRTIVFGNNFDNRAEINELFGLPRGAGTMRGGASLREVGRTAIIWWPKEPTPENCWVNTKVRFGSGIDSRGYQEVLEITEENRDPVENENHINRVFASPELRTRHVFWVEQYRNVRWYKFYGTFELDPEKTKANKKCWYKRVATEVSLN